MPGLDGFEVLRRLRREPAYAAVGAAMPVILLTARADFTAKAQGWEEYADEYVTKPFNVDELARTVQNLLSRSGKIRMA
jgi:two-component system OmpR family response regulator